MLSVVGGATAGAGGAITYLNVQNDGGPELNVVGLGVALGGIAVALIGISLELAAQPHFYDAVNLYNDSLDEDGGYEPR